MWKYEKKHGWLNFRKDFWDCYYGEGKQKAISAPVPLS